LGARDISNVDKMLGYNAEMINIISSRSTSKRYAKLASIGDAELNKLVELAQSYVKKAPKFYGYEEFSKEIIDTTKNKYEMSIIFDKNSNEIFRESGGFNCISYTNQQLKSMIGNSLIHNHPSGTSFSNFDVFLASQRKFETMIAFSGTGIIHKLKIDSKISHEKIVLEYENARDRARGAMRELLKNGKISIDVVNQEMQHFVMSILASSVEGVFYERREP